MRTTFNSVNNHVKYVIQERYAELAKMQKKLATGKELQRASDDPIGVTNALELRSQRSRLEQYEKNMDDAKSWMKVSDTAMSSMHEVMKRANELAVQADNDTLSSQERNQITEEVGQLTKQMASLVNTKYKGNYIFSGSHTNLPARPVKSSAAVSSDDYANHKMAYFDGTAPVGPNTFQLMSPEGSAGTGDDIAVDRIVPGSFSLSANGTALEEGTDYNVDYKAGTITFIPDAATHGADSDFAPGSGNYNSASLELNFDYVSESENKYGDRISTNSRIKREIESGISIPVNTSFYDLEVDNGVNPVKSLIDLGSALLANDTDKIQNTMESLDKASNKILNSQAENGARINFVQTTGDRNVKQQEEAVDSISALEDADYAEIVADYSVAQTVFTTALQSTAKIMQRSLADFI
ncbi:MAG: flagellar hook-associated protein FlgL [Fibrobacterota bacterium]